MSVTQKHYRHFVFAVLVALGLLLSLALPGETLSQANPPSNIIQVTDDTRLPVLDHAREQEQAASSYYEAGQYAEAATIWQQVLQLYQTQENFLGQARVLSNLALAYQQLGHWREANQSMRNSFHQLSLASSTHATPEQVSVQAQILNTQGSLQLAQGQSEAALESWEQAAHLYQQISDQSGIIRSQLNQAQALQALGFYRRALDILKAVTDTLQGQPDSLLKGVALRQLGSLYRLLGDLDSAHQVLEQSLAIAQAFHNPDETGSALISLGNIARSQQALTAAANYYQQVTALSVSPQTALRNQLAQLGLWVQMDQITKVRDLWPQIQTQLESLPITRTTLYNRVYLVQNLNQLQQQTSVTVMTEADQLVLAQLLAETVQQAQTIGDSRAVTYALGTLGGLYEQNQQLAIAYDLTQQALQQAQVLNALDIVYQWQWQLGRILKQQGNLEDAIAIYSDAIESLKPLRGDLAAISAEAQFSFREDVEPIYRELVELLLQPEPGQAITQLNLEKARDVIESLQLARLDDFFKEACLDTQTVQIDQIDPHTAIFYTVLLNNRLDVILHLPQQPLQHYSTSVSQASLESVTEELRRTLVIRSKRDFFQPAQQLYNWLIRPVDAALVNSNVHTLTFVLDGPLQNVPMAALYDGNQFLVENYSLALTPGLKLLNAQSIPRKDLTLLAAGLTEARPGFAPLNYVDLELNAIRTAIPQGKTLLNQSFTRQALQKELQSADFSIVHIATHGQFSSNAQNTFILAWDERINVTDLDDALQTSALDEANAIELLVLSACETAAGDKRAALGIAGIAVKAGARSTVATLWSVNDEATTQLVSYFYQELTKPGATRAKSLQQAQLQLLQNPQYRHPLYWAPYVLVGNWL